MSQIFPNFTAADAQANGPAPIQTMRVKHTVIQGDVNNGWSDVSISLPFAFADSNYTILISVEDDNLNSSADVGGIGSKTASGFNVRVNLGLGTRAGGVLTIHATAIHD